jgi:hypothetical protein
MLKRMTIAATICSRKKRADEGLIPAQDRYEGAHIQSTADRAAAAGVPFYILSGKLGLIEGRTAIPLYDYLLTEDAVPALVERITAQLHEADITAIDFYTEHNPNWLPYESALNQAAAAAGCTISVHQI